MQHLRGFFEYLRQHQRLKFARWLAWLDAIDVMTQVWGTFGFALSEQNLIVEWYDPVLTEWKEAAAA